jgi:hypothetical protein
MSTGRVLSTAVLLCSHRVWCDTHGWHVCAGVWNGRCCLCASLVGCGDGQGITCPCLQHLLRPGAHCRTGTHGLSVFQAGATMGWAGRGAGNRCLYGCAACSVQRLLRGALDHAAACGATARSQLLLSPGACGVRWQQGGEAPGWRGGRCVGNPVCASKEGGVCMTSFFHGSMFASQRGWARVYA